jgi:hypothetical protein
MESKEFKFIGTEENAYVLSKFNSKLVAVLTVIAIMLFLQIFQEHIGSIVFVLFMSLLVIVVLFGIYALYFHFYLKDQLNHTFLIINEDGLSYKYELIRWEAMTDLRIIYVSHFEIFGHTQNLSNIVTFYLNGKKREFHFELTGEEDKSRYLEMLKFLYQKEIPFVEEIDKIGPTYLMETIQHPNH